MLSQKQADILNHIYKEKKCKLTDLENLFDFNYRDKNNTLQSLRSLGYVRRFYVNDIMYFAITESGKAYLEKLNNSAIEKNSHKIHEWINTVIAGLALIVSIILLIKQL